MAVRAAALGVLAALLVPAGVAFADAPSTWQDSPHVSGLDFLVVLFLIPGAIGLVIALLASLPYLIKGSSYHSGQPWLSEGEWFGGPRGGLDAAEGSDHPALGSATDRGGSGATY